MPLERGVNKAGSALVYLASGFKDVQDLNEENENLRKEIAELTETNNRLSQQLSELERLEELYKLDSQYSEYNKVAANVIAKDPGAWYSTFVIDKGTDDGISVDMNVIAGGGLVGIVTETGKSWAVVQSIIDDRSNISAMIASTSDTMVVSGNLLTMEQGTIDFSELRDPDNVVGEGTTVVTSNISTKYLTGLLVGYVSRVEESSNRLTKKGTIIPAADFMHLREVLVITNLKQTKGDSE
jgi:rod shape-determining protein MreC